MLVHNVVPCIIIIGERKFKMRSADLIWLLTAFFFTLNTGDNAQSWGKPGLLVRFGQRCYKEKKTYNMIQRSVCVLVTKF